VRYIDPYTPQKLDSHASALNNKRIIEDDLGLVDHCAFAAAQLTGIRTIISYYAAVDIVFNNTKDVYQDKKITAELIEVRKKFAAMKTKFFSEKRYQNLLMLDCMHRCVTRYNSLVISALQKDLHYFFRTSKISEKGFSEKLEFFEDDYQSQEDTNEQPSAAD
jgi:hypothetical protein